MKVIIDDVAFVPVPVLSPIEKAHGALDVRFDSDFGDDKMVREYLHALLTGVWTEGEGFDGKRPFGNSGWDSEIIGGLGRAGFIEGKMEDGYFEPFSKRKATEFVQGLINVMCGVVPESK